MLKRVHSHIKSRKPVFLDVGLTSVRRYSRATGYGSLFVLTLRSFFYCFPYCWPHDCIYGIYFHRRRCWSRQRERKNTLILLHARKCQEYEAITCEVEKKGSTRCSIKVTHIQGAPEEKCSKFWDTMYF